MYDYALVHLVWMIPPALLLTLISWPLWTKRDVYKIWFLITVRLHIPLAFDLLIISLGRCNMDYALGLILDTPRDLDLPSRRDHWPNIVPDTC